MERKRMSQRISQASLCATNLSGSSSQDDDEDQEVKMVRGRPKIRNSSSRSQSQDDDEQEQEIRRGRGRPKKSSSSRSQSQDDEQEQEIRRERGRPKKSSSPRSQSQDDDEQEQEIRRGRGRPKKSSSSRSQQDDEPEQEISSGRPKRSRTSMPATAPTSSDYEEEVEEKVANTTTTRSSRRSTRPTQKGKSSTPTAALHATSLSHNDEESRKTRGKQKHQKGSRKSKSPSAGSLSSPPAPMAGTVWRFNSIGVPECPLPCRESQFEEIWSFLNENITQKNSRCMYVSGVPGTGKTLIVQSVVDCLFRYATERKQHLLFKNVYINGLSLSSPDKIWKRFLSFVGSGKGSTPAVALKKLNSFFETKERLPVVLVIDELDQLLDKKQSILYQLLEWTTRPSNMFSLIAIFNTMSLPENALVMRNASRMGFVRCIFPPYSHDQLQTIIKRSLESCKSDKIQDEAIMLLSRKVAAVSGDARRALEIARRAVEIVEIRKISGVLGVNEAFKEIFSSVKIDTMKHCSFLEQAVLKHLTQELESSGADETVLITLFDTLCSNAAYDVSHIWTRNQFMGAVTKLLMMKLIITENDSPSLHKKISLNVPFEDVNFALGLKRVEQN